jgi:hypothetical protein
MVKKIFKQCCRRKRNGNEPDCLALFYFIREALVHWTRSGVFGSARVCKIFVHFLCMPKENEPKEMAPVTLGPAGTLRAVQSAWSLKTRCAQTVQTP